MDNKIELRQKQEGESLISAARSIQIANDDDRRYAASLVLKCNEYEKAVREKLDPAIKSAHKTHKELTSLRAELLERSVEAKKIINSEIKRDYLEVEAGRLKDQGRLNEIERTLAAETGEWIPETVLPATDRRIDTGNGFTTIRKDIDVSIADKMTIIRAVAENKLPLICVDVDIMASKKYFKSGGFMQAPGFIIKESAIVVGRNT